MAEAEEVGRGNEDVREGGKLEKGPRDKGLGIPLVQIRGAAVKGRRGHGHWKRVQKERQ